MRAVPTPFMRKHLPRLARRFTGNHQALNLAGAFANVAQLYVPLEFFHGVVLDEALPAKDLHRFNGSPDCNPTGKQSVQGTREVRSLCQIQGYSNMPETRLCRRPAPKAYSPTQPAHQFRVTIGLNIMIRRTHLGLLLAFALAGNVYGTAKWFHGKGRKHGKHNASATVSVVSGVRGCRVDVDGAGAGITGAKGMVTIDVAPSDHYVHVLCPGQRDASYFISPPAGHKVNVDARAAASNSHSSEDSPLNPAVSEMELRRMVSEADQMRANGKFKEAVSLLRKAALMDPRNGDLHRELGITFLMYHDWERARVEMLEAVHREPDDVDAHSGLAYALEKLGDLQEALRQYHICTKMDPHDTSYRDHYVEVLGLLYAQQAKNKH